MSFWKDLNIWKFLGGGLINKGEDILLNFLGKKKDVVGMLFVI